MRSFDGVFARWASDAGRSAARSDASSRPVISGLLSTLWRWWKTRREQQLRAGRLRVVETVSVGEKRFISVVEVDGQRLLIGGGSAGVSLLARLDPASLEAVSSGFEVAAVPARSAIRSGVQEREVEIAPAALAPAASAPAAFADVLRQSAEAAG